MALSSTSASNMMTSAKKYRGRTLAIKHHQLMARANLHRLRLSQSGRKTTPLTPVRVSPKTAKAYGRYLNLSYAEAVQEIFLISQACLKPLGKGGDF